MIRIFTDGSSTGKVGPGGWGFVVIDMHTVVYEAYGSDIETTNNRMELMAVIQALNYMRKEYSEHMPFTVYSDSNYVVKGINEWYDGWVIKVQLNLKEVKNWDLWQELGQLRSLLPESRFDWVRGHDGNEYNEMADKLAKKGKDFAHPIRV